MYIIYIIQRKEEYGMKVMSKIYDNRINSWNFFVETTFKEYLGFAEQIIKNNELQRKRVKTSKTVYSLLKNDLQRGCIIPPIVLAIEGEGVVDTEIEDDEKIAQLLLKYINEHKEAVLILDGLQRTYTLLDALTEMEKKSAEEKEAFLGYKLRLEIYVEINKFGVLYRMLTLNTGQTPMSARHQLEMLYGSMLDTEVDGVRLVTDTEGKVDPDDNQFVFKNAIDGFNSYMNRSELPIDRQDLLENIKMLENMAEENVSNDLFREFIETYMYVFNSLRKITDDYTLSQEDIEENEISDSPFAKKVSKAFSTSQALTGYGAALGKLKDNGIIKCMDEVKALMAELEEKNTGSQWFLEMLRRFDTIKISSKKIGNAQRMFFQYFFRELLNRECDSYLNLSESVENGYKKYYSQVN